MTTTFVYDKYVTGRNFVGRKLECNVISNLLEAGENIYIYGHQKSGKMSLVQQTLFNLRMSGKFFSVAQVDLFNVRKMEDFLLKFGSAVIRSVASVPEEYSAIVSKYLSGTHFVYDVMRFSMCEEVVSASWGLDMNDAEAMMMLPYRISEDKGQPVYVILSEFQNLMMDDQYEDLFKVMEKVLAEKPSGNRSSFIMLGSQVNAMKLIFEEKKYFWRLMNAVLPSPIEDREVIEHVVRGFSSGGKVIERELILGACRLFKSDMWRINHFFSICDSMSKGYINESILVEALRAMLAMNEPYFRSVINDLTDYQVSLLKAVLDGVVKLSASDVIEKYSLNSSANVRRVKDALKKKEVITFNEKDEPVVLDSLFEYWLTKSYFEIK